MSKPIRPGIDSEVEWLRSRCRDLEAENERLREFVIGSHCYCNYHDGRAMPSPCERCELLGQDNRHAKAGVEP